MAIDVFISYARADAAMREQLVKHLAPLQRAGLIRTFHDRLIEPGADWRAVIGHRLNAANLILLLISADFLASNHYDTEMRPAIDRHHLGAARVIPIIL